MREVTLTEGPTERAGTGYRSSHGGKRLTFKQEQQREIRLPPNSDVSCRIGEAHRR